MPTKYTSLHKKMQQASGQQINPFYQPNIDPKYGLFDSKNEVPMIQNNPDPALRNLRNPLSKNIIFFPKNPVTGVFPNAPAINNPYKRGTEKSFFNSTSSYMFAIIGIIVFMLGALLIALFWFISKPKKNGTKHSKKKRKLLTDDTENLIS